MKKNKAPATRPETAGARADAPRGYRETPRPETMPIYQTSVFSFADVDDVTEYHESRPAGRYLYTRNGNPNVDTLAESVAAWEQADAACAAASGMGAISGVLFALCRAGDHILLSRDIYGGTFVLARTILERFGVTVSTADLSDASEVERAVTARTSLIVAESIANPLLQVADIPALADAAHERGALLMIDNTFATPFLCRPLALGADLVVHSATKYIGGHSDVSAGAVCGAGELVARVQQAIVTVGASLSPFEAWLAVRGVKTFHLRMERQCANALHLAKTLALDGRVQVHYPGLPSHPQHRLAQERLGGHFGAIVTIRLPGGGDQVNRFMNALPDIPFAPSLAGVRTTLSHPWTTSHRGFPEEDRLASGITPGLVRISVGIEEPGDLTNEILGAIDAVFA